MQDSSENLLSVAIEIRELLRLLAEPAIAQRDETPRASVRGIAGKKESKQSEGPSFKWMACDPRRKSHCQSE